MLPLSEEDLDIMVDRERGRDFVPLNDWDTISTRLRAEGLIRDRDQRTSFGQSPWMRAAAAVLIAVGGIAFGRYSAPKSSVDQAAVVSAPLEPDASAAGSAVTETPAVAVASRTGGEFHSIDEAWATLNRAGAEYQKASAFLAANNSNQIARSDSSAVYQTRLEALDQVLHATRSALNRAPNDPVINQYYMATIGAHEATQQQLKAARTAGLKVRGF